MTVIPFLPVLTIGAAMALNATARRLAADVKLAMKRADLSIDYVSRVIDVPPNKLSDQLNGKAAFTSLWRFFVIEDNDDDREKMRDWHAEFVQIQAERLDRAIVSSDIGLLLQRLDALIGERKPRMTKMPVTPAILTRSVELPLRGSREEQSA